MWEWLKNADNLSSIAKIGGAVGSGYAAIQQSKSAKGILDMQKRSFAREEKALSQTQLNLDNAVDSVYAKKKKKPTLALGY